MDPLLLSAACQLYHTQPHLLTRLSGGHYNDVYQFPLSQATIDPETGNASPGWKYGILRLGIEDCPPEQTMSMLDWVSYMKRQGAPVAAPLPSSNGRLLEHLEFEHQRYNLTAFEKATGTLAEDIPPSAWTDDLFRSIGSAVGKFHHISSGYQPGFPGFNRPHWFDSYEVQDAFRRFADSSDPTVDRLRHLIHELRLQPTSAEDYGLIHEDLHFANFLVGEGGLVTVIDFDDCAYGWFAIDIAMALFDVLVLYNAGDETESQHFARRFMTAYLSGYRREFNLTANWLSQIPRFLKLKELCVYATLVGHPDIALPDTWVGRFMRNRAERIAFDLPYVDIDFSTL